MRCVLALLLSLSMWVPPASAAEPGALAAARRAIEEDLDFTRGAELLRSFLATPDTAVEARVEAYRLLAPCEAARADSGAAEEAYLALLHLDPEFTPAEWQSPKVKAAFDAARARWSAVAPELILDPPEADDESITLRGRARDPQGLLTQVELFLGTDPKQAPSRRSMTLLGRRFEHVLPRRAGRISYFVEGRGAEGQTLARAGSAESPLLYEAPASPDRWYEKWWVWTIAGVAAAGVAVGVAVAATSGGRDDELFELRVP